MVCDQMRKDCEKRMDSQHCDIERLYGAVSGVDPPGLCTRVDRLEQVSARLGRMSNRLLGGIIAALAAAGGALLVR